MEFTEDQKEYFRFVLTRPGTWGMDRLLSESPDQTGLCVTHRFGGTLVVRFTRISKNEFEVAGVSPDTAERILSEFQRERGDASSNISYESEKQISAQGYTIEGFIKSALGSAFSVRWWPSLSMADQNAHNAHSVVRFIEN